MSKSQNVKKIILLSSEISNMGLVFAGLASARFMCINNVETIGFTRF